MDRKEFILNVLGKGRLDINGFFSNCFLFPDIPDEKTRNARKMHGIDKDEDILFLRDLTQSGSAEESIVITEKGVSYVFEEKAAPLKESWDEIIKIEFHNGKFVFFFDDQGEDGKDDMDASEFTGCDQKGPNKFFAGLLTEIASEFQDEDLGIQEDRPRKEPGMDRGEFILTVLEKGRSMINNDFYNCFLAPDIPKNKVRNARKTHELDAGENILFLTDLDSSGSAEESIVITENCLSVVINKKRVGGKGNGFGRIFLA